MRDVVYLPGIDADTAPVRSPEEIDEVLVRALARKSLSEEEAAAILRLNGLAEADVPEHIAEFVRRGYLNDSLLAEELAERLLRRKGLGRTHIERNLRERKLRADSITAAMEAIDLSAETERAREWAERRAAQLSRLDPQVAERRLVGFLSRKGYSSAVALHVSRDVLRPSSRVRFD